MFTRLHDKRHQFQVTALLSVVWFALFVVLVPIFHRHAGEQGTGFAAIASVASAVHAGHGAGAASPRVPTLEKAHGLTGPTDDDCPLCQWFGVGFTPPCLVALLTLAAALVALLFDVRLAELCRRPLPRRGLRAPPVCVA